MTVGEIVYEEARPVGELVPISNSREIAVAPEVTAKDLVRRLGVIREAAETAMERDVDYGVIPGTDKQSLLKPGAEKLSVLFQLDVQLDNQKSWGPGDHLTVSSHATVFHAPSGVRLGYGEGMCSTREAKYAYRNASRKCPACGAEAIIKGKAEYGGGWLCFKKKNGCGAKFADADVSIVGQEVGQVDNPALPDMWNTVVKMAEKRARVDAVLAVTGASALFTQDMEDQMATEPPVVQPEPVVDPLPPVGKRPSAAQREAFEDLLGRCAVAQPTNDKNQAYNWPSMAEKLAQADYGHGLAAVTKDELAALTERLETHLAGAEA